jgi:hypothetical protein
MWSKRETLQFTIKLGLRKGLALIRGMRRSLTDDEQDRVAKAIADHLELSNWKIDEGPPQPEDAASLEMTMDHHDQTEIPVPNGIVMTMPPLHYAAAAKLRQCGDPASAELADAHERVAREMQECIDREAPPLAPD